MGCLMFDGIFSMRDAGRRVVLFVVGMVEIEESGPNMGAALERILAKECPG